jgi:hypothetical protein
MPILVQATQWATNRMPKAISPKAHAIIDYAMAASFFGMAGLFWRRDKRAAVSCLVCGAAETLNSLLTDYPGGIGSLSFETHGAIDFGLVGLIASVPGLMRFSGEPEARFFRLQGMAMAAVTGLTDFTGTGEAGQRDEVDRRASRRKAA